MSEFTEIRDEVENFFISKVPEVEAFFKPFIASLEAEGKTVLIAAATSAVATGEATPGTGEAKMLAALASFSATVLAQGIPYVESEARALIEVALQNFKSALGASSTSGTSAPAA